MSRSTNRPRRAKMQTPATPTPAIEALPKLENVPDTAAAHPVVIQEILPAIEGGRHPIKRTEGEDLTVEADIFKDGHDLLTCLLKWRLVGETTWRETPMAPLVNDRWQGVLTFPTEGTWEYVIEAWGDTFFSWREEFRKKYDAGLRALESETLEGAALIAAAATRANDTDTRILADLSAQAKASSPDDLRKLIETPLLEALMQVYADRSLSSQSVPLLATVDRLRASYSAWYEFFPRSAEGRGDRGSTFRQCIERIDDAKRMGFDVIYFPPIHPIGEKNRKGRNNSLTSEPGDPGVPYAIGNKSQGVNGGGHKDVAPELGTLEDFDWLVSQIRSRDMEIALDFAINCSPDHPYVTEHPDWFFKRPDGSIKYAENPPKKYEDVYPLNFHCADWRALWEELRDVIAFWCARGVRIFRVDNPHTKPIAFWQWTIASILKQYPGTIFLSEAFTRPKMMQELAKVGFTQSYTYFTWRNTKYELTTYMEELTKGEMRDYFRPNFFVNTPDILPVYLQEGGRPAFMIRAVLAATLSPLYGIYSGFELCENSPVPGKEEYIDSEKYHFRERDWNAPGNIKDLITKLNAVRIAHRSFRDITALNFHEVDNENILFYSRTTPALDEIILVAVTVDFRFPQTGFVNVPLEKFGIGSNETYAVEDLLTGEVFRWTGSRNFISLDPHSRPAHVFRLRRNAGREDGQPVYL